MFLFDDRELAHRHVLDFEQMELDRMNAQYKPIPRFTGWMVVRESDYSILANEEGTIAKFFMTQGLAQTHLDSFIESGAPGAWIVVQVGVIF